MQTDIEKRVHAVISAGCKLLDDRTASTAPELFGTLQENGSLVEYGTRINWKGLLKKAAVDLWDTRENNPDNAPALWEEIPYREGYRLIPENISPAAAFSEAECGWWKGMLYRSRVSANVYTPDQYPGNWETAV